ncbi:hypothetical protein F0U59_18440 [Archangium gephyra]|nr:hypothetical protein F0U59_18440 [Archangium gephyra]
MSDDFKVDLLEVGLEVRNTLEKALLQAFPSEFELQTLARQAGISVADLRGGNTRILMTSLLEVAASHGRGRQLSRAARRLRPDNAALDAALKPVLPRHFSGEQLQELGSLLGEAHVPWQALHDQTLSSIPENAVASLSMLDGIADEAERRTALLELLSEYGARKSEERAHPLLELAARLLLHRKAHGVEDKLKGWVGRMVRLHRLDVGHFWTKLQQELGAPFLLVKIPEVSAGRFQLQVYLGHHSGPPPIQVFVDDGHHPMQEIEGLLRSCWEDSRSRIPSLGENLTIEFLLPLGHLLEPVDQWLSAYGEPLGARYTVVIRPLERIYVQSRNDPKALLKALTPWKSKWRAMSAGSSRHVWVHDPKEPETDAHRAQLIPHESGCVAVTPTAPALPGSSLRSFLQSWVEKGMPAAVWIRRGTCSRQDVETFLNGMLQPLSALPTKVREQRLAGLALGNPEHFGRHLSLLWDDPGRVPEDAIPTDDFIPAF